MYENAFLNSVEMERFCSVTGLLLNFYLCHTFIFIPEVAFFPLPLRTGTQVQRSFPPFGERTVRSRGPTASHLTELLPSGQAPCGVPPESPAGAGPLLRWLQASRSSFLVPVPLIIRLRSGPHVL